MMKPLNKTVQLTEQPSYNLESPLWQKYFKEIRSRVRFPRNYKEVSSVNEFDCVID